MDKKKGDEGSRCAGLEKLCRLSFEQRKLDGGDAEGRSGKASGRVIVELHKIGSARQRQSYE